MTSHGDPSTETLIAQGMQRLDAATGSVVPALQPSTTFARDSDYRLLSGAHSYARDQNPTFLPAEQMLARLEGAHQARLFSSGMAAAMAVVQALRPGDRIVAPAVMYWGLRNWLRRFCADWGLVLDFYDGGDPDDLARQARRAPTRLIWVETPSNPIWEVVDIAWAAELARETRATLAVDSTVATPVLTRPIELGADIVVHSATKYLNGHGDLVAGALATARDDELWQRVCDLRANAGAIPGTFEAWLLQRGMRTLFLRVQRCCDSAMRIAEHFVRNPRIEQVLYPGLPDHPGHAVARRQMHGGFGGMLSLRVRGGAAAALAAASRCRTFVRATSLGGVESLIEHRRTIEGPDSPVPDDLLRLSIGIEASEDLIADLQQALG